MMFTLSDLQSHLKEYAKRGNIGEYTYGTPIMLHSLEDVTVGKFCSIAQNVTILGAGEHDTTKLSTYPFHILMNKEEYNDWKTSKGPVKIGNDVWIGHGATILSGVTIGDGAIIGAETLVTKDVEPYEIVGGNPQKHIRYRFDSNARKRLLKLCWWDLPQECLTTLIPLLLSNDITALEQAVEHYQNIQR